MTKKRGNGEGSIFKRKDGRWAAAVDLGWLGGKRRRKTVYGRTRGQVAGKLAAALRAQSDGLPVDPQRQTVGQYLRDWLEHEVKQTRRESTYASYESLVRVHLIPEIGRHQLDQLEPQHVQAMLNRALESGLSPRTVQYLRTILHMALERAVRWGLASRNVAALVDPPRMAPSEAKALTPDEAERFLRFVPGDRLGALWTLGLLTGLRRGEALALQWSDVDLDQRTLTVRASLHRVDGRLTRGELKSKGGRRTIAVPRAAVDALRSHRTRQLEDRLVAGSRWQEGNWVFPSSVGTPLDGRNVTRRLQRLLQEAELPRLTFHGLRHSCASLLVARGVHPRIVMETLGHSRSAMTMEVYAHVSPSVQREAADAMDEMFRGGRPVRQG